ncbi:MAG: hypothetical protein ACI9P5_004311 [Saprospiraceae bacterium]|jgi:hypothetical protein
MGTRIKLNHMKNILVRAFIIMVVFTTIPRNGVSQEANVDGVWFDVMRVYPSPTLDRDTLTAARKVVDIHKYFKSSWIREFISVEVYATVNGIKKKASSKNDILTEEQKRNMDTADVGTQISVFVNYMPENTLKNNEPKVYDFSFLIDAETEARHSEGKNQLKQYLSEKAISKLDNALFEGNYKLAAVKFAIDEDGQIVDAYVSNSSDDKKVDSFLLEAVCNMPSWEPAEYANGQKTKQEFVLAVGSKESCNMNLLNLKDTIKVEE